VEGVTRQFGAYGLKFTESQIINGPASVESEFDELFCGPDVVIHAMQAQKAGADAAIVLCMGDPGVAQAREACSIPIIGPGEVAMHYAAMLGHKFTVIPTLERRRSTYEHHARHYGVESRLASVRPAGVPVLEIEKNSQLFDILLDRCMKAVEEDHADVLILGCIGFQGVASRLEAGIANRLKEKGALDTYVPVIDPLNLSIMTAAALVRSKLSHSKRAYPKPPVKPYKGYTLPEL
jgi:allantoin racemase